MQFLETAALVVQMAKKYLLALDQSTQVTGWALFENGKLIQQDTFNPTGELEIRLTKLRAWLDKFLDKYPKEIEVALEEIQLQNIPGQSKDFGVTTYKKLAYVQGVIIELLTSKEIKYTIVPSVSWKSACGIKGKARKEQKENAAKYVESVYGIKPIQDICDAICIGHYCLKSSTPPEGLNWGF